MEEEILESVLYGTLPWVVGLKGLWWKVISRGEELCVYLLHPESGIALHRGWEGSI